MAGTELTQQRAHASTPALEKPLPGTLFPSLLWFKPAGFSLGLRNLGCEDIAQENQNACLQISIHYPGGWQILRSLQGVHPTGKHKKREAAEIHLWVILRGKPL